MFCLCVAFCRTPSKNHFGSPRHRNDAESRVTAAAAAEAEAYSGKIEILRQVDSGRLNLAFCVFGSALCFGSETENREDTKT